MWFDAGVANAFAWPFIVVFFCGYILQISRWNVKGLKKKVPSDGFSCEANLHPCRKIDFPFFPTHTPYVLSFLSVILWRVFKCQCVHCITINSAVSVYHCFLFGTQKGTLQSPPPAMWMCLFLLMHAPRHKSTLPFLYCFNRQMCGCLSNTDLFTRR